MFYIPRDFNIPPIESACSIPNSGIALIYVINRRPLRLTFSASVDRRTSVFMEVVRRMQGEVPSESLMTACAVSHDGRLCATDGSDNALELWDTSYSWACIKTLQGHTDIVIACVFSYDDRFILSASADNTLRLWDTNGNCIKTLQGHRATVTACTFNHNDLFILSASFDRTLKLWDRNGNCINTLQGHTDAVTACAFSYDDRFILSASADKTLKLWDRDGNYIKTLQAHTDAVSACVFSYDDRFILSASADKTLRLWDTNGNCIKILQGHTDAVTACAFSHDGRFMLSASFDRTLKLWDTNGNCIKTLQRNVFGRFDGKDFDAGAVVACTFSNDDRYILSASSNNAFVLWDAEELFKPKVERNEFIRRWNNGIGESINAILNSRDSSNNTILHRAAKNKHLNLCARLLYLGANKDGVNAEAKRPLSYLSEEDIAKIRRLQTTLNHHIADLRTTPTQILAGVIRFQGRDSVAAETQKALDELCAINELQPLLDLAKLAALGWHDLSKRDLPNDTGYDSDNDDNQPCTPNQRLSIIIDPAKETVENIAHWGAHGQAGQGALGVYFFNENTLHLGGMRLDQERRGTLIHEMTHFVAHEVFKNNAKPYSADDIPHKTEFELITQNLRAQPARLDPIIKRVFESYAEPQYHAELIVRVPQMLVHYGYAAGLGRLNLHPEIRALLQYYTVTFLPEVQRHVEKLQLRILGGWPLGIFTQGFAGAPGMLEMV